jgi:hypothetical protein
VTLQIKNTLAYYHTALITAALRFVVYAQRLLKRIIWTKKAFFFSQQLFFQKNIFFKMIRSRFIKYSSIHSDSNSFFSHSDAVKSGKVQ